MEIFAWMVSAPYQGNSQEKLKRYDCLFDEAHCEITVLHQLSL